MTRFNQDNTEGYTDEQLIELNKRFDTRLATYPYPDGTLRTWSDPHFFGPKSIADHVAEQVLAEFDTDQ